MVVSRLDVLLLALVACALAFLAVLGYAICSALSDVAKMFGLVFELGALGWQ